MPCIHWKNYKKELYLAKDFGSAASANNWAYSENDWKNV